MLEFLLEAVAVTLIGGFFGILAGAGMAYVVVQIAQSQNLVWEYVVPPSSIVLGLGVAGGIGIIFGVFPARRAANSIRSKL